MTLKLKVYAIQAAILRMKQRLMRMQIPKTMRYKMAALTVWWLANVLDLLEDCQKPMENHQRYTKWDIFGQTRILCPDFETMMDHILELRPC